MGIKKADRVALVGYNSSRYLTIDVAIGLVGAVSVPLYYTSPPGEIDDILISSSARLLFVGSPRILERLDELSSSVPVISFCREHQTKASSNVIAWEEFLKKNERSEEISNAPVGLGDLATIRYSSGTTGRIKGVCFDHSNLRWMAESVSSIFPWQTRNKEIRYLSFLPLNHVVEGIIGAYSPYYSPAPLKIYFLEDFSDLQKTLTKVHPTVFFSVPRFYEKMWEGLQRSRLGQSYLQVEGIKRAVLRCILKWILLKRAGLNRCDQLIVGSAPSSEDLLHNFQEMGIEVHNAYGLTEAPLVTINRVGSNRIDTVGEPLPRTELRVAEDGEIMVRGPQVTHRYLDSKTILPLIDGWLLTGDLGKIAEDGKLVIYGRKKELLATSYGKKIHPSKIESMLKEIRNVDEAMVVGENRPYVCAILWVKFRFSEEQITSLEKAIMGVNNRLSHPEQVKRWAILLNDLSIENGDLTANLKIKRQILTGRFLKIIEALYGEPQPTMENLIHIGGRSLNEP